MNCPSCQQLLAEDVQFCGTCGSSTASVRGSTQGHAYQSTSSNSPTRQTDHETPQTDPRVGLILDSKYKLVEHLGEGGMGSVFRAQRLHIGDEVAVKLLHRDLVREKQALERFRREARAAAMIRHQNVVSIHDFSEGSASGSSEDGNGKHANSEAYIVMELVKGVSLGNLLRREGRMYADRAIALMRDICAGVGVAHRQGLLHRDLKPDNVIITPPNQDGERESAKVVDFGLAKVRDAAGATALTHTGALIGTLCYMSPEQCAGEELDARTDVYSLGAMLYEMLTGDPPFRSNNLAGLIAKHINEAPPPFPESLHIPAALASACFRALSKDRNKRQQDAIAFGRELQTALAAPTDYRLSQAQTVRHEQSNLAIPRQRQTANPLKWILVPAAGLLGIILLIGGSVAIKYGIDRFSAGDTRNNQNTQNTTNNRTREQSVQPVTETTTSNASTDDLTGTWTGTYGPLHNSTKLIIKNHKGNELDGILEQGPIRVAFKGSYDSASRTINFKQTDILEGDGWSLGEDAGKLSADGKKMTGTGKDAIGGALGMSYEWSFARR